MMARLSNLCDTSEGVSEEYGPTRRGYSRSARAAEEGVALGELRIAFRAILSRCIELAIVSDAKAGRGSSSLGKFTECPKEVVMDQGLNLNGWLQQRLSRRDLFRNAGVAGISLSALLDLAWQPATSAAQAPAAPASAPKIGAQLIGKLEGPTTVTDPAKFPKTFKEAPQLAELVKAGKLPSVKETDSRINSPLKPGRLAGALQSDA
ncbi:MAG TPA: hypothetical protein VK583_12360 [Burkholderiales bacterium]|nr:hypothetical protein [Burkholderiales bacterium]